MNLNLTDKTFIVSGSSRGIGKGIAGVLLAEGANVVLTGRNSQSLAATFEEFDNEFPGNVVQCAGDLNIDKVRAEVAKVALGRWKTVHGVIANAAAVRTTAGWDIPEVEWHSLMEANFDLARRFVSHFIPHLIKSRGNIVIINSIAGIEDVGAPLPYSVAKAALRAYAALLARQLAPDGVRVNTIAPGNILFPGGNWAAKQAANPHTVQTMLKTRVPLKRFGSPVEIGQVAAFLVSEQASFLTGCCIVVDGGQLIHL